MGDDHIAAILKMLEEGRITASEAEKLLSALGAEKGGAQQGGAAPSARAAEPKAEPTAEAESGPSKSFEFRWNQKRGFPMDLGALSKQIQQVVKKVDPERILRDARAGGKRWQEKVRHWGRMLDEDEAPPRNDLGLPTASTTETQTFDLSAESIVQVENKWGPVQVRGGADGFRLDVTREAWAPTQEEAAGRLRELKVDCEAHIAGPPMPQPTPPPFVGFGAAPPPPPPAPRQSRLDVQVCAPEGFREGTVSLTLHVPGPAALRLATTFGAAEVRDMSGSVEVHTVSGSVGFEELSGSVRAEGVSGAMRAVGVSGHLGFSSKSGDLSAERLSKGGSLVAVSGDVRATDVDGGRLEARSVSGDVRVERAGVGAPIDLSVESVSGDVHLASARGNVALKTVSGDAVAEDLNATMVQAQAVSGDMRIHMHSPLTGTLTTSTVSGDVEIRLPGESSFRFTLATQSGELRCEHTAHDVDRTDTLWTGTVGTGVGVVNVQTLSGDVRLGTTD
ncbi:MAG: DUF4097 family beta strand repeat protein [Chthonomonadales bacterium]|nr:DUF4097 family beta strand repeat protein [Chthonomonadales bacterium]